MWHQILAIGRAQFRVAKNHIPKRSWASLLLLLFGSLWYCVYLGAAVVLILILPDVSFEDLEEWLPVGLLGAFIYWQLFPLFTLSSGWSLQLNKLQIYPISTGTLFGLEVILRLTAAPEMLLVLLGTLIGLLRHPDLHALSPFALLLFFPPNLFLSLAIREFIAHSFKRNRFRELFAMFVISIGVFPQLLLRTGWGRQVAPYLLSAAHHSAGLWSSVATLALGRFSTRSLLLLIFWTAGPCLIAYRLFVRSLGFEEMVRVGSDADAVTAVDSRSWLATLARLPGQLFSDPLAALIEKELQSLFRMPKFRVVFGMACVFSIAVFLPFTLRDQPTPGSGFIASHFLSVVSLYGLLLLSDILILNSFGLDQSAAQLYVVAPVRLETVLKAKNIVAVLIVALQAFLVLLLVKLLRFPLTWTNVLDSVLSLAVIAIFFLSAGNISSITMARPADPRQTFKKQAGGKAQVWLLVCSIGMFLLLGLASLAQWALDSNWAFIAVLIVELAIGAVVYWISLQSALERHWQDVERMLDALSKGASPIGFGS